MKTHAERHLKTGGDPRTLADYAALRDEVNKLTHPARPDVNWQYAEKLCLSLFENNGVELQTAAWYTQARTQLAGLYGMNEGLAILESLVTRQWGNIWPQPVHARMEIFSALSKRLQQVMRTQALAYADLGQLYQAEEHLKSLGDVLQRLELKHVSQLDTLHTLIHNAAVRLENSDNETTGPRQTGVTVSGEAAILASDRGIEPVKRVYVVQPEPQKMEPPSSTRPWKPFATGMLTMLVVASAAVGAWHVMRQPDPAQILLTTMLAPMPTALSAQQVQTLRQYSPEASTRQAQQQLTRLLQLKPDWAVSYGDNLVKQMLALWPEQATPLAHQWQQQITSAALPPENLNDWHQGMLQLQQLENRLNALDEQKGKYMTVSELKSAIFTMTQSFNRAVPAEEQLRQLSELPQNQPWPAAQQSQLEQHLQQLIARYALMKQKTSQ